MHANEHVVTHRETTAIQIPQGTPITLPAGTPVTILQTLGGTYTVATPWGQMVRVEAADADALGKEPPEAEGERSVEEGPVEERVWDQLRTCYDPEIPVNVVDLGLIYDCSVEELNGGGHRVGIKMTLTAPGCGMGPVLADDVRRRVESVPGVESAEIEIVFDPPWNPNMMTEAARLQLGLM
jgi:probable FeS assembly SUF system protein SufT